MKTLFLIAAVVLSFCSGAIAAEPLSIQDSGWISTTITLHKATPSSILWGLGLLNIDDQEPGNTRMWRADKQTDSSKPMMGITRSPETNSVTKGLDFVVACDDQHILVVCGEKASVEQFKSLVALMDVAPRIVQVKIDVIKLEPDKAKKFDFDKLSQTNISESQAVELRKSLLNEGAEFVASPILTASACVPAKMSVSDESFVWEFSELSKINPDNTITTTLRPSVKEAKINRSQELFTTRRIAQGESIFIGGFVCGEPAKELFFLVTPKIVD